MLVASAPRVNFVKFVQLENTFNPNVEMFPLIVISVKPLQPEKALFPIEVNVLGRVIEVKLRESPLFN